MNTQWCWCPSNSWLPCGDPDLHPRFMLQFFTFPAKLPKLCNYVFWAAMPFAGSWGLWRPGFSEWHFWNTGCEASITADHMPSYNVQCPYASAHLLPVLTWGVCLSGGSQSSNHSAKGAWSARGAVGSHVEASDLLAWTLSVLNPAVVTAPCVGLECGK